MWQGIVGHDVAVERFRSSLAAGRLASTYLFVGPAGVGKRSFALQLARALLCQGSTRPLEPCGGCESCQLAAAGNHPDLLLVSKPPEKSSIPVELFIGKGDKRGKVGLCHDIALKPFLGGRRIAIVDDADLLNQEGANCLLKTLEEPPPHSVLILIGNSAAAQLPTIRSRCQVVRFEPLSSDAVVERLLANGVVTDRQAAESLALLSGGSLERAGDLAASGLDEFRGRLFAQLAAEPLDTLRLTADVSAIVDEAGREAPLRRARLRQVITLAIEFYRGQMRLAAGMESGNDPVLIDAVARTAIDDPETPAKCIERCLEALEHVDRNANQATLIECWIDDLGQQVLRLEV